MRGDVAIIISKSGATDELNLILNHLKRLEIPIIAMTGNPSSNLTGVADVTLDVSVDRERVRLRQKEFRSSRNLWRSTHERCPTWR